MQCSQNSINDMSVSNSFSFLKIWPTSPLAGIRCAHYSEVRNALTGGYLAIGQGEPPPSKISRLSYSKGGPKCGNEFLTCRSLIVHSNASSEPLTSSRKHDLRTQSTNRVDTHTLSHTALRPELEFLSLFPSVGGTGIKVRGTVCFSKL